MSKTVKTIAWICLMLGLLGVAMDTVVLVRAQTFRANMAERIESGEMPYPKGQAADKDGDGGAGKDGRNDQLERGQNQNVLPGGGRDGEGGRMPIRNRPASGGGRRFGLGLPLLFAAAGPILAVIGAVTLIVNREPKGKETKAKKTTKKEKTQKN